ncbi:MAG: hypothetical protein Q4P36_01670 [Bowdeniella nasicola]|nr:hypothetical protein [Bowdeniella nasicola]
MSSNQNGDAERLVADPQTSAADLYRLCQERPDLRPQIAVHPNAYEGMLQWLGGLGDPDIDAALARRAQGAGGSEPDTAAEVTPTAASPEVPRNDEPDELADLVASPDASAQDLHRAAAERPDLRPQIAAHPHAYPDLLSWLATLGDPDIDAALAARQDESTRPFKRTSIGLSAGAVGATTAEASGAGVSSASTAGPTQQLPTVGGASYGGGAGYGAGTAYNGQPSQGGAGTGTAYAEASNQPSPEDSGSSVGAAVMKGLLVGLVVVLLAIVLYLWRPWHYITGDQTEAGANQSPTASSTPATDESDTPEATPSESETPSESPSPSESPEEEDLPYLPEGVPNLDHLSAPSGNISCGKLDDNMWGCTIWEHDFTEAFDAQCAPNEPVTVAWPKNSEALATCTAEVPRGGTQVPYGDTVTLGEMAGCTSTRQGMSCWGGDSNLGFTIARRGVVMNNRN